MDNVTYKIIFQKSKKSLDNLVVNKAACFTKFLSVVRNGYCVKSVIYEMPNLDNYKKYAKRIQTIFPYLKISKNHVEVPYINLRQCFVILTILRTPLTVYPINSDFINEFCKKNPSIKRFLELHNSMYHFNFLNSLHLLIPKKINLKRFTNKKFNRWLYDYDYEQNKNEKLCHSIITLM